MTSEDPLGGIAPYPDFATAAEDVVKFLHSRVGLDLWMVTQIVDDQQVALVASPPQLAPPGTAIPWAEGFCSRMVSGRGPRVASVTAAVPDYAGLTFGPATRVSSYLGVPLLRSDAAVYGTVCGFGLRAAPPTLSRALPLVEQIARLLSTILALEGTAVARQELVDRAVAESERDVLTGLLNRRGWIRALGIEEARSQRSGNDATVLVLDLDGLKRVNDSRGHQAGDELLRRTADVLRGNSRPSDVLARTGGDEFAVLMVREATSSLEDFAGDYAARLAGALAAADCPVSIGYSARSAADEGMVDAWTRADASMYEVKTRRRAGR